MPEVRVTIGGRDFDVACQEGEEHFLRSAAQMLDTEARVLVDQIGRMPESRMLLMAGLMLADKTAGLDEQMRRLEDRIASQDARIEQLQARGGEGAPIAGSSEDLSPILEGLAERAERLAEALEARIAS
ncbi:cell division protein ZapA [Palleronia sp. KMU-117]|uniref:cell division protein ZapA n=1 Tax=Palleronia sp. KMU-117 TaxID=3434108 RepID=UPI003D70F9C3